MCAVFVCFVERIVDLSYSLYLVLSVSGAVTADPEACPSQWSAFGEVIRPPVTVDDDVMNQTRHVRYQR